MSRSYRIYGINKDDKELYNTVIKPKLEKQEGVNLFFSITYITPNYYNLHYLTQIAELVKKGFTAHIVLWDMNTVSNSYFKRFASLNLESTLKEFTDNKVKEIKNILLSLGVPKEKFKIFKSFELWKRLISLKKPNLFLQLYQTMTSMYIKEFHGRCKVCHLFQMPADIFMANFLHKLYPEEVSAPVDVIVVNHHKQQLYSKTRKSLYEAGIINLPKPFFLEFKAVPFFIHDNRMPEWNMNFEDIMQLIINFAPSKKDIQTLFETVFQNQLGGFIICDKKGNSTVKDYGVAITKLSRLSEEHQKRTLAQNMFNYLQKYKNSLKIDEKKDVIEVSSKNEALNIGKVLRSTLSMDIIHLADGTKNISQIARELKKQVTNISTYVSELKKQGLIEVLPNGNVNRNIKALKINFEVGLN